MHTDATFAPAPQRSTPRRCFFAYTPRAQAALQCQQFFFDQKEKLSMLLNTVGHDARMAPCGSQIGNDYFELTTVITQLLEDASIASGLTLLQIESSGVQMQPFAEKVQLCEHVAVSARERAQQAAAAMAKPAVSRKRGRVRDEEEEEEQCSSEYKRYRHAPQDHNMVIEPSYCGPYADHFLQTAWWTQPVCD
ncbi:hypothetical protein Tdes44962_MAKER04873 [Teratosphaeria destructans]|uniref:Uncharacterized protein n=1 Tax=Teratosphaeria destructans TaxID=418781 RepID=A0A9W7SLA7_9PEZI|nr:hypothetical protein Tdes44962_MAKER04873 [Teratosphaeria destructans]